MQGAKNKLTKTPSKQSKQKSVSVYQIRLQRYSDAPFLKSYKSLTLRNTDKETCFLSWKFLSLFWLDYDILLLLGVLVFFHCSWLSLSMDGLGVVMKMCSMEILYFYVKHPNATINCDIHISSLPLINSNNFPSFRVTSFYDLNNFMRRASRLFHPKLKILLTSFALFFFF